MRHQLVREVSTICAGYDPERAMSAVARSAGLLTRSGVNVEQLLAETSDERA